MSAKSILEADGKAILNYHLTRAPVIKPTPLPPAATHNPSPKLATINFPEDADDMFISTLFGKVSTDLAMSVEDRGSPWLTVRRDLRRAVAEQEVQEHTALLLRAVHNAGPWT